MKIKELQKMLQKIFLSKKTHAQHSPSTKTHLFILIASQVTVQLPRAASILSHHFFCFRSLMFVMFIQSFFVILLRLGLLFRHHTFRLADGPTGTVRSTRAAKHKEQYHPKNSVSFHLWLDYGFTKILFLKKTSTFAA